MRAGGKDLVDEAVSLLTWSATPVAGVSVSVDSILRLATFTAGAGFSGMTAVPFQATDVQGDSGVDTVLVTVKPLP